VRIFNKFRGTKGFITTWERVLRFRYMVTGEAKRRVKILAFWERYGTEAVEEAFGVKKRTLYLWQKKTIDFFLPPCYPVRYSVFAFEGGHLFLPKVKKRITKNPITNPK